MKEKNKIRPKQERKQKNRGHDEMRRVNERKRGGGEAREEKGKGAGTGLNQRGLTGLYSPPHPLSLPPHPPHLSSDSDWLNFFFKHSVMRLLLPGTIWIHIPQKCKRIQQSKRRGGDDDPGPLVLSRCSPTLT